MAVASEEPDVDGLDGANKILAFEASQGKFSPGIIPDNMDYSPELDPLHGLHGTFQHDVRRHSR